MREEKRKKVISPKVGKVNSWSNSRKRNSFLLTSLFVIDRMTKTLALENSFAVINKGVSFGFFASGAIYNLYFCLFLILASLFLLASLPASRQGGRGRSGLHFSKNLNRFFLGLIIVGGLSNLIDRILYGGVVDFIAFPFSLNNNLADFAIVGGIILLLVDLVKR